MLAGYAIIAVPTGIVSSEMKKIDSKIKKALCERCQTGNPEEANYCMKCGDRLVKD